jgi:hypothetical protein
MKVSSTILIATQLIGVTSAFSISQTKSTTTSTTTTALSATNSRREALSKGATFLGLATTTLLQQPQIASAAGRREPLPEYLTEPTEEFKESERRRDEFRRQQLVIKRKFNDVLDRLTFESKTEDELRTDLEDLRDLVTDTGGLPLGVKKDEMVKIIRAKKAKGFWPTSVEYAYQKLISEIAYQQSPNRDKDIANPL